MGKKGKKGKKKSKAQLEEEARLAEEAARIAEEERLKKLEEERVLREQQEAERRAKEEAYFQEESDRLQEESAAFEDYHDNYLNIVSKYNKELDDSIAWNRFASCNKLPDPSDSSQLMDYIRSIGDEKINSFESVFKLCEKNSKILEEVTFKANRALEKQDEEEVARLSDYSHSLRQLTSDLIDKAYAYVLQYASKTPNEKNEFLVCEKSKGLKCGIWININKNPRVKVIEMPDLDIVAEIPKSVALATVAVRILQVPPSISVQRLSKNKYINVGGLISFDLLSLPPTIKKTKTWTVRQVNHLSTNISCLSYPIAPAGTDPSLMRQNSGPIPPIRVTCVLESNLIYKEPEPLVGWWDPDGQTWEQEGISEVTLDKLEDGTHKLSFLTTHLTSLALLQSRTLGFPYTDWFIRPLGGRGSNTVMLTLSTSMGISFEFEVGEGYVKLASAPLKGLSHLENKEMNSRELLNALKECGLNLLPVDEDGEFTELTPKDKEVEYGVCEEMASICRSFLISSSKWNKEAGSGVCLARISEILDFGRTMIQDVTRIFDKEKTEPPRSVSVAYKNKKGVTFVNALNSHEKYNGLLDPIDNPSIFGEIHYSMLTLLEGSKTQGIAGTADNYNIMAQAETLSYCRTTSPILCNTLADLLYSLRIFSFS
ncbi:axonemal protein [Chloropicon primus]|uniref:Axonemal protein n=1 Tax=Chloropicon primus TaxID=1764295 RepID=A0A5B8ME46_9CHLO|nr:axonemal protein [Chloropicon primus]UPQ96836.1 axonemal protein [Chloropicon primus]|eukprot:QDZ17620.1 axonemal protein [Chloropicon primus]